MINRTYHNDGIKIKISIQHFTSFSLHVNYLYYGYICTCYLYTLLRVLYTMCILIHCTMAESTIIMMSIQTVMLSVRSPNLTRLIVTEPSLSLTVLLPMSNCMVTIGATVAVSGGKVYTLNHQIALVNHNSIAY